MLQLADEIGMSAGNLYRYFPSKEAIVEGLCAVGQAERAEAFTELLAHPGDLMEAICASLREHVVNRPPEKARMIVEMWAEAGRNPRVAAITEAVDADVLRGLEKLFDAAKAAGAASESLESRLGASFFFTFVGGLFKRLATEPAFDPEKEGEMAVGVLKALLAGALAPPAVGAQRGEK
jgi:AcrR family transcriptional regulator